MNLELPRGVCDNFIPLHQYTTKPLYRCVTINHEVIRALGQIPDQDIVTYA
uniref:Uncharacterized protein n=1 Tax=Helianthus annuus TaxID=4232 RepID=A0A251RW08_HELAN